jgi:hypothetical protein
MIGLSWPGIPSGRRKRAAIHQRVIPGWTILFFCLGIAVVFSPNVFAVYGLHNDYEMLNYKSSHFFHPEAEALFAIARPVAALLTNLTMLPVNTLADFRWTRIFSILTVCFLGSQMISLCIQRLRTRAQDAIALSLVTFLVLPFIYSVINATAWSPHLVTVLIAFVSYRILSDSNVLLIAFLGKAGWRDIRPLTRQAWGYFRLKPVWLACLVYQLALYDYPPNALILVLFPIIAVLFSRMPASFRTAIAVRDIFFIGGNVFFFLLTAKVIYLPFVRLFTSLGTGISANAPLGPLATRLTATYRFDFNADPGAALARLKNLLKVTGDLWFLPQTGAHLFVGAVVLVAIIAANILPLLVQRNGLRSEMESAGNLSRLRFELRPLPQAITLAIPIVCFVMAGSAILASATGFVTYRTIAIPTAVVAIMFIFSVRSSVGTAWWGIGSPFAAAGTVADLSMALVVCVAIAANFYVNDLTMRLSRNELAYFTGITRQAIDNKSHVVVIVDPRPFNLPEDIPVVYDQQGRAVPPYELGCFSGYCLQTGSIVQIVARELGYSADKFKVYSARGGDPIPGLTCEMLAPGTPLPADLSEQSISIVKWFRSLAPLTCVTYSLDWHDVGIDLSR